ncbi:putative oxidoreductase [Xylophilus ampelinus]|nr:putative oxidoreductase [Xylophilus ampelinus]
MSAGNDPAAASRLFDVAGRGYVVTGAASGIGLAISHALAANEARVLMVDRDAERLEEAAARFGGRAVGRVVDVGDADGLKMAVHDFAAAATPIYGLFANAGISGGAGFGTASGASSGQLQAQDAALWHDVLEVNLLGVLNSMQAVIPAMKQLRRSSIVVTASIAGLHAEPFVSYSYAAAKAAVAQLVRMSALELAAFGIRVNGIAPGFVRTGIAQGRLHDPDIETQLAGRIPFGRLGEPAEVQGVALLLASDASSYVTGAIIPIDGGVLLGSRIDPISETGNHS